MQVRNYIINLGVISVTVLINSSCYTMDDIPSKIMSSQSNIITINKDSAPLIEQNNDGENKNIDYYKQENIELKSKVEILSKDLEQLKINYNKVLNIHNNKTTEMDNEKWKRELKILYKLSDKHTVHNADFLDKNNSNNAWNAFYVHTMNIINGMRNDGFFKDHYKNYSWKNNNTYKNINCNSLFTIQNIFVEKIQNKIRELNNCKKYFNKLLEYLPESDNNLEIRNNIISYINNYLEPVTNEMLQFQLIPQNINLQENILKIDEHIGKIEEEFAKVKNKLRNNDRNVCTKEQDLYYDIQQLNRYFYDIIGSDFFKNL